MALPVGVTYCTVTVGSQLDVFGNDASLTVEVTPIFATDRRTNTIVWSATGQPLTNFTGKYIATAGTPATFVVPHVDQAGFIADSTGEPITGWYYEARVNVTIGRKRIARSVKRFRVITGQTAIDLDLTPSITP